jgi:hypothetical protein
MDINEAKANGKTNLPHLAARTADLAQRLPKLKASQLDEVERMFDTLVLADSNAEDLATELPGPFGIEDHDTRYLHSLRDQKDSGRPLTKQQLLSLKVVLQSERYMRQLALLMQ